MSNQTKRLLTSFCAATFFGVILVAPFVILEIWNNPAFRSSGTSFPLPLFGVLWLLPTAFFLTVTPIVRHLRAGESILAQPMTFVLRVATLAFVLLFWIRLVVDQMPCFLGVPNCD